MKLALVWCCLALVAGLGSVAVAAADGPLKDEKSGIAVKVKADGRTLAAEDKDGKAAWEVDVIKAAGAPAVGLPVIRHLSLQEGRARVVYGKHSFAEFDLRTGKLVASGSD